MNSKDFLKFLNTQKENKKLSSFYNRTAEIVSQYIPDLETAKLLLENNKNLISNFEEIPGLTKFVHAFIQKIITDRKVNSVLDPWTNFGEMLYLTENVFPKANKIGYVINDEVFDFNTTVRAGFNQKLGNSIELLNQEETKYDLIISNLPVGLSSKKSFSVLAKTDVGLQIMIESLSVMNDDGLLISTVNSNIFQSSNAEKFKSILIEKGYCIKAIFGTPVKSVNQNSSIPFYLIVIEKGDQNDIFLAEITDDQEMQNRIIGNFKKRRNAREINEGILLPIDKIKPIFGIIAQKELDLLIKRTGLPLIRFDQLGEFKKLSEVTGDWLILSRSPNKKVELGSSKEGLSEQFNYFFQINTEVIEPKYLLEFFNSSLGNRILNSKKSGSILPVLEIRNLLDIGLPLDTIKSQRTIIELDRKIQNIEEQFRSFRFNLWKNPKEKSEIAKNIKNILKDPNSIEWMEELPFPLASILWGYHSESKTEKKVEYLFLFFEGLCEFVDTLLLSALVSNRAFFDTTVRQWLQNEKMQDWYVKSSFGGWQKLHEKLAKNVRTLFNEKEKNDKKDAKNNLINDLFCGASEEYINMLTSKNFVNTFSEINKLRNDFKGHGGISSENLHKEILMSLETKFYNIKEKLVMGFSSAKLLSPVPKTMDWNHESEVFTTTCRLLKGTRSRFNQIEIQTNSKLSSKKLYILHDYQFTPLEVLPFVQMRESPRTEQNACYFYNRIDGDQVRLVSYHFDKEAELFEPLAPISNIINILNPLG